jgi:hypothetical protein
MLAMAREATAATATARRGNGAELATVGKEATTQGTVRVGPPVGHSQNGLFTRGPK